MGKISKSNFNQFTKQQLFDEFQLHRRKSLKKAETALAERTRELSLTNREDEFIQYAVDLAVDMAFWPMAEDASLVYINEAACTRLGYTKYELLNMRVPDFDMMLTYELWPDFVIQLKSVGSMSFETTLRTKDGELFPVEITARSIMFGNETRFIAFGREITERKNKEKELKQAKEDLVKKAKELNQASNYKSQFLANMSHELRTPLNSILLLSKLMSSNTDGNLYAEQIEFANVIHESGNSLLELINDILDLTKIESGKLEMKIEELGLSSILKTLDGLFRPLANEKGITFKCRIDKKIPGHIMTDRVRLQQVLKNLISNAIKFTIKGSVEMHIFMLGKGVSLENPILKSNSVIGFEVKDSGIGIPKDKIKLIFEPFKQADGSTQRKFGGTGLGLSISRDISHTLGGELIVSSIEGKGSTFTLLLPIDRNTSIMENDSAHTSRSTKQ